MAIDDGRVPRPPRDQSTECLHHVMGRGCRGQPILGSTDDREHFAFLLTDVVERYRWTIYDWVFMPNHHHLLVRLEVANLAKGMHRLHFMFGQRWNERSDSRGHVLFRRYTSIPLRRENAGVFVMRYIDLNPVRAGLCALPDDWEWSGYLANVGKASAQAFHTPAAALRIAAPHLPDPLEARLEYARGVHHRLESTRARGTIHDVRPSLDEIVVPGDLESLWHAHHTWWYSIRDIGRFIGRSHVTVARWIGGDVPTRRTSGALRRWAESA